MKKKNNFSFNNKNVVFILKSFALGGAEKQALYLANYLKNHKNCNIYIYAIIDRSTDLFLSEIEKYGLKNIYLVNNPLSAAGKYKYIKRRIKILKFGFNLRKHKPDIIIPYLNPPSIITALCRKISGAKYAFWHHRGEDYYRNDKLESIASQKIPFFIANSIGGCKELNLKFKRKIEKFKYLPNFSTIQTVNIKKEIQDLNKISESKIVIGMIAHFRHGKRQLDLVESFYKVSQKYSNLHLVLVGNVYEKDANNSPYFKVSEKIKNYNLEENISIIHNHQALDILPYFNIGVLVSDKEGMPNTVMEYMAYSLPVVATNHDGCISLLGKEYLYYVNKRDVNTLANKLESLLSSEKVMKEVGLKNKERLSEFYNIENYILKLTAFINECK